MLPASTVPQSGQVLVSHHCRVSSMTYSLHLNMMIRQMVSRGLVYPLRVSRLTYTAPEFDPGGISDAGPALRGGVPGAHGRVASRWKTTDRSPVHGVQELSAPNTRRSAVLHSGLPE